jgi:pimeloyl-ACP methyl ester carboxylesterase
MELSVDGRRVYVGTGSGHGREAPILFVHGAGMDHTVWVMPTRYFARHGRRVLAPDLPGHGASEGPPFDSIEAIADWLECLLDAAGVESAAVAGHSMGALAALAFASRHASRCRAVALLGPSLPMPVSDRLLDAARANDASAIEMANAWSHSAHGRMGGNDDPGRWMLGLGERLLERAAPGVFHADLAACNAFRADGLDVSVPTLVVVGEADQMTPPKAGLSLAARIANARTVRLPGCGHSMLAEQPNQVLDALIGIL